MADIALRVGVAFATVNVVRIVEAVWVRVCTWVAPISAEPGATIVMSPVELFTVATKVL